MKERVISGIIIAIILGVVIYYGGVVFDVFSIILAALAFKELIDLRKDLPMLMKFVGLLCVVSLILSKIYFTFELSFEILSVLFLGLLAPAIFIKKYKSEDAFYLAFVVLFISTIFNLLIKYNSALNKEFIYIILVACSTDVFALFGGKLIGKHKLTPISPKKTIEGSVVGTLFATIICTTFYSVYISNENMLLIILITILLSIVGQIGDIFFSLIKRENDKKDFANLIPGHGGILDRLDSIIFVLITYTFLSQFL